MPGIGELAVRLAELGEAEGRLAKRHTIRVAVAIMTFIVGFAMMFVGLVFLVFALYYTLRLTIPRPGALAIMGGGVVVLSVVTIVIAKQVSTPKPTQTPHPPQTPQTTA